MYFQWLADEDEIKDFVVEKGSITVDGISLTVSAVRGNEITLDIIPETLKRTALPDKRAGAKVNIEVDILAKYIENMIRRILASVLGLNCLMLTNLPLMKFSSIERRTSSKMAHPPKKTIITERR